MQQYGSAPPRVGKTTQAKETKKPAPTTKGGTFKSQLIKHVNKSGRRGS